MKDRATAQYHKRIVVSDYETLITRIAETCKHYSDRRVALYRIDNDIVLCLEEPPTEVTFTARNPHDQPCFVELLTKDFASDGVQPEGETWLNHVDVIHKYDAKNKARRKDWIVHCWYRAQGSLLVIIVVALCNLMTSHCDKNNANVRQESPSLVTQPADTQANALLSATLAKKPIVVLEPTWIHPNGRIPLDSQGMVVRYDSENKSSLWGQGAQPLVYVSGKNVDAMARLTGLPAPMHPDVVLEKTLAYQFRNGPDQYTLWGLAKDPKTNGYLIMLTCER